MAGKLVWGVFLIAVGLGLVVFNKPYATWVGRVMAWNPFADQRIGRPISIVLGLVMIVAGGSAIASLKG